MIYKSVFATALLAFLLLALQFADTASAASGNIGILRQTAALSVEKHNTFELWIAAILMLGGLVIALLLRNEKKP